MDQNALSKIAAKQYLGNLMTFVGGGGGRQIEGCLVRLDEV